MERPVINGQTRRMNLNPPSPWQGFKNCFLEVMSEWIRVRMEQERREEGKMDPDLLGDSKCCILREIVFSLLKNIQPSLVVF